MKAAARTTALGDRMPLVPPAITLRLGRRGFDCTVTVAAVEADRRALWLAAADNIDGATRALLAEGERLHRPFTAAYPLFETPIGWACAQAAWPYRGSGATVGDAVTGAVADEVADALARRLPQAGVRVVSAGVTVYRRPPGLRLPGGGTVGEPDVAVPAGHTAGALATAAGSGPPEWRATVHAHAAGAASAWLAVRSILHEIEAELGGTGGPTPAEPALRAGLLVGLNEARRLVAAGTVRHAELALGTLRHHAGLR